MKNKKYYKAIDKLAAKLKKGGMEYFIITAMY